MRTTYHFIVLVVVSVLVAALLLSPGAEERAAMLAGEGRHREVIASLEQRLVRAPHDPEVLAALGRSYADVGEARQAIDVIDTYLLVRPNDLAARKRQAELLLRTGLLDRYLDAKARIVAARPSPEAINELVELFRLHGRVDDEIATLRRYGNRSMLTATQLERLGSILAARGDLTEARPWLEAADRNAPPNASVGRLLLLEVLLHSKEFDEAYQLARGWIKTWLSPYLSGKLILRMAQSGAGVPAGKLAVQYTDLVADDRFDLVGLLAREGHWDIARQMLGRWAERTTKPDPEQFGAFVQASAQISDISGPLLKLARFARAKTDPAMLGDMAENIADTFGSGAFVAMRPLLPSEVLTRKPLLGAELSLFEGNRELARWYLNQVEPTRLSSEQSAAWFALLDRVETDADRFTRLAVLWNEKRLPSELAPYLAEQAAKRGQPRMHDAIWDSLKRPVAPSAGMMAGQ